MKIVIATLVLISVYAASAGVTENIKVYKPTLADPITTKKIVKTK